MLDSWPLEPFPMIVCLNRETGIDCSVVEETIINSFPLSHYQLVLLWNEQGTDLKANQNRSLIIDARLICVTLLLIARDANA
jgi:hypothetical protein